LNQTKTHKVIVGQNFSELFSKGYPFEKFWENFFKEIHEFSPIIGFNRRG